MEQSMRQRRKGGAPLTRKFLETQGNPTDIRGPMFAGKVGGKLGGNQSLREDGPGAREHPS